MIISAEDTDEEYLWSRPRRHGRHGHTTKTGKSRLYKTWSGMHDRCYNPNQETYKDYGGRGISVCPEWWSFWQFARDMGERPEGMTLDRIDNDRGYCPQNCRWSTQAEQIRNQRRTGRKPRHG